MQGGETMAMLNALWPFVLMGGIFAIALETPKARAKEASGFA